MGRKDPCDEAPARGREREQHFAAVFLTGAAPYQAARHELVDHVGRAARLHQDAPLHLADWQLPLVVQHLQHAELGRAEAEAGDAGPRVAVDRVERPGEHHPQHEPRVAGDGRLGCHHLLEPPGEPTCSSNWSISNSRCISRRCNMVADLGLLALRVALGLVFLAHGTQKAFGAFGGPGFAGATGFIGNLGFRPARLWAALAVGGELAAGLLYPLGLLTPLASLLVLGTMAVAIAKVHGPKGFFVQNGGFRAKPLGPILAPTPARAGRRGGCRRALARLLLPR